MATLPKIYQLQISPLPHRHSTTVSSELTPFLLFKYLILWFRLQRAELYIYFTLPLATKKNITLFFKTRKTLDLNCVYLSQCIRAKLWSASEWPAQQACSCNVFKVPQRNKNISDYSKSIESTKTSAKYVKNERLTSASRSLSEQHIKNSVFYIENYFSSRR